MDKKIGKKGWLIGAVLFVMSLQAEPSLSLRVTDQEENSLQAAGLKMPFLIHVEVLNNERKELEEPHLILPIGIELLQQGKKSSMRSVNGQTIVKYSYLYYVVAHEEGTFKIGPAHLGLPGNKEISSNEVAVYVAPEQRGTASKNQNQAFLEISVSNKEPYVGQVIIFHVRFYFAQEGVHLDHIQEPVFQNCKTTPLVGPKTGSTTIKGIQYQYLDWELSLYALKPGKLVLPALSGQMSIPVSRKSGMDLFSMMNSMFTGVRAEKLYSNAVTLMVQPLPAHESTVSAVGNFTSFNAKVGSEKALTGEGVTFTLELVGQGNVMAIVHPKLLLPDGLKYYDSHAKEHALTDVIYKKDFEYVIQGLKSGTYVIPAQTIEFFDIKSRSYKSLQSRSLKLIIAGESKSRAIVQEYQGQVHKEVAQDLPALENTLNGGGSSSGSPLSWGWFGVLVLLCCIPLFILIALEVWAAYRDSNISERQFKQAFLHARSRAKESKKKQNPSEMYHIFMELFSKRFKMPRAELSEAFIEKSLKNAGFSDEKIKAWRHFFSHLMAVTFSALPHHADLYEEVDQWIETMELFL